MTIPSSDNVLELNKQVRDLINNPRKHYELRQNWALFLQLCSCLDAIGDADLAIAAYDGKEFEGNISSHYLAAYGLLQSIYVQQDAVINLCESLAIPERIDNYPKLKEIREVRNDAVGHPTKRNQRRGQSTSYHNISSVSQTGFTLASFFSDGSQPQFKHIDLVEIIAEQRKFISGILQTLISNLEAEDKAHKEKYRVEKLISLFPETIGYNLEKTFEGIFRNDYAEWAALNLDQINEVIQKFREAIGRRNMDFYEELQDSYDLIKHAVGFLSNYYRLKMNQAMSESETRTARIFASFIRDQVDYLKSYAMQIDEEYVE